MNPSIATNYAAGLAFAPQDSLIKICSAGEMLVTVHPDGTVEMNPNLPADECARQAAQVFWEQFGGFLKAKIHQEVV